MLSISSRILHVLTYSLPCMSNIPHILATVLPLNCVSNDLPTTWHRILFSFVSAPATSFIHSLQRLGTRKSCFQVPDGGRPFKSSRSSIPIHKTTRPGNYSGAMSSGTDCCCGCSFSFLAACTISSTRSNIRAASMAVLSV